MCIDQEESLEKDRKMSNNTKKVDRVLLVVEGSPCEQQGSGQDSHQDEGGEDSTLGLGLHLGPGSSHVRGSVRGR